LVGLTGVTWKALAGHITILITELEPAALPKLGSDEVKFIMSTNDLGLLED
jgi:hypothetical protein